VAKKKTRKGKRQVWNKGRLLGQREPFSPSDVDRLRKLLASRGNAGLRDLALFSTAMDTMLRASDLLGLTVKDVRKRNRVMRDTVEVPTANRGRGVRCTLSKKTMVLLEKWIDQSAKRPGDHLFTGRIGEGSKAISARQLSRLVKTWAEEIGLDESLYGTESLRRTRSIYILDRTGNMEAVRVLLGLKDVGSAARYLGHAQPFDVLAISRTHEI
jgi:integrase